MPCELKDDSKWLMRGTNDNNLLLVRLHLGMEIIIVFPFATVAMITLAPTTGVALLPGFAVAIYEWLCRFFITLLYSHSAIAIAFKATVEVTVYPIGQTSPASSATTTLPTKASYPEER
jgi:hypothetical protein